MKYRFLRGEFSLAFIGPMIATFIASITLGIQTFTQTQYQNFQNSDFYKGFEKRNEETWDKVNRNKDVSTLGANTTVNENNLKVVSYKEGFVNEKIASYIKSTKKIFNLTVKDTKVTLNDGYIEFFASIDDSKTIKGKLRPSESQKNLLISDIELTGFGNLESATKTTLENFVNLNKDFLSRYFSEKIEKIEIKQGEIVIYFALSS